jgi:DNA-binding CsgD family transcriptional regulator
LDGFGGHAAFVRPRVGPTGLSPDSLVDRGELARLNIAAATLRYFANAPEEWSTWDPVHIAARDRNQVRRVDNSQHPSVHIVANLYRPLGIDQLSHMMVLLTDGPMLLGWLGLWREQAYDDRDEARFKRLSVSIRQRLQKVEALGGSPVTWDGIETLMDALARPAWLVRRDGTVELANSPGRRELAGRSRTLCRTLAEQVRQSHSSSAFSTTSIESTGSRSLYLVVLRQEREPSGGQLASAVRSWALTVAQGRVLQSLVEGSSNKEIAAAVGCAEATVELHVAAIFAKANVRGRGRLIAKFWKSNWR